MQTNRRTAEKYRNLRIDEAMAGMEDLKRELTHVEHKKHVPVWAKRFLLLKNDLFWKRQSSTLYKAIRAGMLAKDRTPGMSYIVKELSDEVSFWPTLLL